MSNTKYLQELKFAGSGKPPSKDQLYFGVDITVDEFTAFIGGKSNFKKAVQKLQATLMKEIKRTPEIKFKSFGYADWARIGWARRPGELMLSYTIWAVDDVNHMMAAEYRITFTGGKNSFEIVSGWDG